MADASLPSSQPSLQELCEKKWLNQILPSDPAASEFASLEPHLQEILFSRLRTENARLREVENKWRQLTKFCPPIDIQIHLKPTRIEPGGGEDEENGYNQKEVFLGQWSYFREDDNDSENESGEDIIDITNYDGRVERLKIIADTTWSAYDLDGESPESDLEVRVHDHDPYIPRSYPLHRRISSQLLLYRLTATFGMPPPKESDGYKSCWEIDLKHCDGISMLSLQDFKGAADVYFNGTTDASGDALKLLNFLIGMNCPHTYDGIVAGTMA